MKASRQFKGFFDSEPSTEEEIGIGREKAATVQSRCGEEGCGNMQDVDSMAFATVNV